MKRTFDDNQFTALIQSISAAPDSSQNPSNGSRQPVHVLYGGAHLYGADTTEKLGRIALRALDEYAPNFVEFAKAVWLPGADTLPNYPEIIDLLENDCRADLAKVKKEKPPVWLAWTVYHKVKEKLGKEAIEDYRVDFEDGYGFRPEDEEDAHALTASDELAKGFLGKLLPPFCGFRIKSLQAETACRALRTLDIFLTNLLTKLEGKLPPNFVVTLPKVENPKQVTALVKALETFERRFGLTDGALKLEILIETPTAIFDADGRLAIRSLVDAAAGRCVAAHFGAYDFTSSFGIVAERQHLQHDLCKFARQMMQVALAPTGIRLSDSVTTVMPVPIHRGENLTLDQRSENRRVIHHAWRAHFNNVTRSLINGFYQSWDLHPAQLVPRYAAVYAFFLESADSSARRLGGFMDKATQAMTTGNQFDDLASANGLLNYFSRAISCAALSEQEVWDFTGLTAREVQSLSFAEIMSGRNYKAASVAPTSRRLS